MLVMDDGWFGHRSFDDSSLGDWTVNEIKIKGGLKHLVDEVNKLGMKFGIWFEPEMISPDSDLYRAHPDWAIQIPGREPGLSRQQLVLDLTRKEVEDYTYESVAKILRSANIEYVKWDMNRHSIALGAKAHAFTLGVYDVLRRIFLPLTRFPLPHRPGVLQPGSQENPFLQCPMIPLGLKAPYRKTPVLPRSPRDQNGPRTIPAAALFLKDPFFLTDGYNP